MYRPRHFDIEDKAILESFMREQSFALLITTMDGAPFATHLPLILDSGTGADGGNHGRLLGHVAKANTQWQGFDGKTEALVVFSGPHAYVSPNWYVSDKMVPTWNYVTVHAYGRPRVLPEGEATWGVIKRLTDFYESEATGNWSMDMLPEDFANSQLKGITAFEMPIDRVQGKFKLSQNRRPADREGVMAGLRESGDGEAMEVARLMAKFNPAD